MPAARSEVRAINRPVTQPLLETAGADSCVEQPEQLLGSSLVARPLSGFGELGGLLVWRSAAGVELRLFDPEGVLVAGPAAPNLPRFAEPRHVIVLPDRFLVLGDTDGGCARRDRCRGLMFAFSVGLDAEVSKPVELALAGQHVLLTLTSEDNRVVLLTDRAEWIELGLGGPIGFSAVGRRLDLLPYVAPVAGDGPPLLVTTDWRGSLSIIGAKQRWDLPGPDVPGAMGASASTRLFAQRDSAGSVHLMWTEPPKDGTRSVHYVSRVGEVVSAAVETNPDLPVRAPFGKYVFADCCLLGEFSRRSWPDDAPRGHQAVSWDARLGAPLDMIWNGRQYVLLREGARGRLLQTRFDCR